MGLSRGAHRGAQVKEPPDQLGVHLQYVFAGGAREKKHASHLIVQDKQHHACKHASRLISMFNCTMGLLVARETFKKQASHLIVQTEQHHRSMQLCLSSHLHVQNECHAFEACN